MSDPHSPLMEPKEPSRFLSRLRNYFLTGLVVAAPVTITVVLVMWFVDFVDAWFTPMIPDQYRPEQYLDFTVPGLGVIIAVVLLTLLGALTANLFGRTLVNYGERLVGRMPLVRNIYGALKQIFETVLSQSQQSFREVALIEYPRRGVYSIAFVTTAAKGEVQARADEEMVSVFLPTTPNPTSGFLLFVPRRDVITLEMSVEDAAKMVISAGLVAPEFDADGSELPRYHVQTAAEEDAVVR
ncbi:MAG: DUF502 domain-containing protein [Pseudomonadota bacterium]